MSEQAVDYLDVLGQPSDEPELAAQASKKKRKMSEKQRKASMKNLRLARMAQRAKKQGRHKAKTLTLMPNKRRGGVALTYNRKGELIGKKRVASAKQRAAARKNIKKAQAARARNLRHTAMRGVQKKQAAAKRRIASKTPAKTKRLTTRVAARSTARKSEASMKKGKGKGGKRKTTAKQRAAARKNIKKAQKALRAKGKRSGGEKKTLAKRSAHRTAVAPPKPKKAARRGEGKRRFTQKARAAAMRNLGKARAARKRAKAAGRKHPVRSYSYHSKPKRVRVPAHRSYERGHRQSKKARAASLRNLKKARAALRHGGRRRSGRAHEGYMEAMVNALSGVEVVIGFMSTVFWFMVTDFVDRLLATHALTDKGAKDAAGHELYMDTPPTTGDYTGLFNPTAICAPMNVWRWLVGLLGMTGVPLALSFAVSNDVGRASLQAASFGAGIRIVGKALIDLVAYVTMWTPLGQQLYDGEMRAQVYASGDTTSLASLPSTGLGGAANDAGTGAPAEGGAKKGTGWPSMPRETAGANSTTPPPTAGAVPTVSNPNPPGASQPGYLAGLPSRRPNHYQWGYKDKEAEEVAA